MTAFVLKDIRLHAHLLAKKWTNSVSHLIVEITWSGIGLLKIESVPKCTAEKFTRLIMLTIAIPANQTAGQCTKCESLTNWKTSLINNHNRPGRYGGPSIKPKVDTMKNTFRFTVSFFSLFALLVIYTQFAKIDLTQAPAHEVAVILVFAVACFMLAILPIVYIIAEYIETKNTKQWKIESDRPNGCNQSNGAETVSAKTSYICYWRFMPGQSFSALYFTQSKP